MVQYIIRFQFEINQDFTNSSQWTSSSTPCAEGRNIPYSNEIYWRNKVHSHESGRHASTTHWRQLECWRRPKVQIRGLVSQNLFYWKRNLPKDKCVVREETDKSSDDCDQWIQSYLRQLLRRRRRVHESFSSRRKAEKSKFIPTIHSNLAHPVKNYRGIISHQRVTDLWMELLRDWYAEFKKELLLCCCSLAWMKHGGRSLWNLRNVHDLLSDGKTLYVSRFGEPFFEDQWFRLAPW